MIIALVGAIVLFDACIACTPPFMPHEFALVTSPWSVTKYMEVKTMDGKKSFGSVSADMLQLDSVWKWTDNEGSIVTSAKESMMKMNSFMGKKDAPATFTVNDCARLPFAYVRELKQNTATQTWGRAYEFQVLDTNRSMVAHSQVGLKMDISLKIVSADGKHTVAMIERPTSRFENEWRIKILQPGSVASDPRTLVLIAGQAFFRGGDVNFVPVLLIGLSLFCTIGAGCGFACYHCKKDKTVVYNSVP